LEDNMSIRSAQGVWVVVCLAGLAACTVSAPPPDTSSGDNGSGGTAGGDPTGGGGRATAGGTTSGSPTSGGATSGGAGSGSTGGGGGSTGGGMTGGGGTGGTPAGTTEVEPNDSFATAQVVKPGDVVQATLKNEKDVDFYSITIPDGALDGVLTVSVTETDDSLRPWIQAFRGSQAKYDDLAAPDATTKVTSFPVRVSAGKQYFFEVSPWSMGQNVPAYAVKFDWAPVSDAFERNDDFPSAKPLAPNAPVDLVLFAGIDTLDGADVDVFAIHPTANAGKIHVTIANESTMAEPQRHWVQLYDSTKAYFNDAADPNDQADLDFTTDLPTKNADTIYVKASLWDGHQSATPSKLTVTFE
jgi:hypothetical protein